MHIPAKLKEKFPEVINHIQPTMAFLDRQKLTSSYEPVLEFLAQISNSAEEFINWEELLFDFSEASVLARVLINLDEVGSEPANYPSLILVHNGSLTLIETQTPSFSSQSVFLNDEAFGNCNIVIDAQAIEEALELIKNLVHDYDLYDYLHKEKSLLNNEKDGLLNIAESILDEQQTKLTKHLIIIHEKLYADELPTLPVSSAAYKEVLERAIAQNIASMEGPDELASVVEATLAIATNAEHGLMNPITFSCPVDENYPDLGQASTLETQVTRDIAASTLAPTK